MTHTGFSKLIIVLLALSMAGAIGFFAFQHWNNLAFSSHKLLSLAVDGPGQAAAGSQVTYTVRYVNNGSFPLDSTVLSLRLPPNAVSADGRVILTRTIGAIGAGEAGAIQFSIRLLGNEGDAQTVSATMSYMPQNLSVHYRADASFTTTISHVPITLQYQFPKQVEAGQPFSYTVTVASQMDYPLNNAILMLNQPAGFTASSFSPSSIDQRTWNFSTFGNGDSHTITVTGQVAGGAGNSVRFSARVSARLNGAMVTIKDASQDVSVAPPPLSVSQLVNGTSDYQPVSGKPLAYEILVTNTSAVAQDNVTVSAKLAGDALDTSTFQSTDGQFDAPSKTVRFGPQTSQLLVRLAPGQQVTLRFSIALKPADAISALGDAAKTISDTITAGTATQVFDNQISL